MSKETASERSYWPWVSRAGEGREQATDAVSQNSGADVAVVWSLCCPCGGQICCVPVL